MSNPVEAKSQVLLISSAIALIVTCLLSSISLSDRNDMVRHLTRDSCESACARRGIAEPETYFVRQEHCYCSDGTRLRMDVGAMWLDEDTEE